MKKIEKETTETWSVAHIKHSSYPEITVRVGEFQRGGILHVFRQVNGKQTSRSLKCRRCDLGSNAEEKARRLAYAHIEGVMNPSAVVASPGPDGLSRTQDKAFTIRALADKYQADGFAKTTASYKRDALASIRRIAAFLDAELLVRDMKPSHVEKYLAARIAKKHAPAGRADLVALGICCGWAVGEGLLDANPLASKRAHDAMKIGHTVHRPLFEQAEVDKLKAVAHQLPPAFDVIVDVAWGTGRRISAILGLRWLDVLDKPDVAWRKCKELDADCRYLVEDFKNGGIRWYAGKGINKKRRDHVCPMSVEVRDALDAWKKQTKGIGARFVFVAPSDSTKELERHQAKKWLKRAEGFAKLDHQAQSGWHAFRRGWATKRKHFPIKDLARAGDWADEVTPLKNYVQTDRETTLACINMA